MDDDSEMLVLKEEVVRLRKRLVRFKSTTESSMEQLRMDLRNQLEGTHTEMEKMFDKMLLKEEVYRVRKRLVRFESMIESSMEQIRVDLRNQIEGVRDQMKTMFDKMVARMDDEKEETIQSDSIPTDCEVMAGTEPDGSLRNARQHDGTMNGLFGVDGITTFDEVYDSFDEMGLQENLLRGIYACGFEKPTAIQQKGIVPFCEGLDVIQQAERGTGRTVTFCSGILQQLDYSLIECQALILAPTWAISQQIAKLMRALGDYLGVKVHACAGGTSVHGVHVVVSTPGVVVGMLRRHFLCADNIKMFVLYEADEMLTRGFKDQIHDIFRKLPANVQVGVVSATMPPDALEIIRKFMNQPVRILAKHDELTLEHIIRRIGRGGRFGRRGVVVNFATRDDEQVLADIGKFYNVVMEELSADVEPPFSYTRANDVFLFR